VRQQSSAPWQSLTSRNLQDCWTGVAIRSVFEHMANGGHSGRKQAVTSCSFGSK
jgi:hypothetical protein